MGHQTVSANLSPLAPIHRQSRTGTGTGRGRGRTSSRRKEEHTGINDSALRASAITDTAPPGSPEVISSLITSLSVISRPASAHFDLPLDIPKRSTISSAVPSQRNGSFGVQYGGLSQSSIANLREEDDDLDELAASPPIIKTAKPPSGFSPLTAPNSPRSRESSVLRSFLSGRNSPRPSSTGSIASREADAQSIGNLSIERGATPSSTPPPLTAQRSHDSWGRKLGRGHKGLMYMTSKERLRDNDERRRSGLGAVGSNSQGLAASAMKKTTVTRPETFLAETAITEERSPNTDRPSRHDQTYLTLEIPMSPTSVHPIPTRDSSLRKTGSNAKRPSARTSRSSRRNSLNGTNDTIHEADEQSSRSNSHTGDGNDMLRRRHSSREDKPMRSKRGYKETGSADGFLDPSRARTIKANDYIDHYVTDTEAELEGGAPAPSIGQTRRRKSDQNGWRRPGQATPELLDVVKPKRSNSRLKRLSGPLSPRTEDKGDSPGGDRGSRSEQRGSIIPERPLSTVDSIDDAVDSYLCSPRLSQKIKHPQTGRVISFSEVGDAEGSAVFCCVGMGLTRYITAFYDELALTLKLRLITPDRPGVGDSEAYADGTATPLSWPDDVYAICQTLKITKFSILAHSAGAIYALATALRMPQHIRGRIHLLAPWIPPSQMSVFGSSAQTPLPPTNAIPTSQRILRALPTPILKAANSSFMSATSSSITSSLPKQSKRAKARKASAKDRDSAATRSTGRSESGMDNNNNKENQHAPAQEMVATEEMDRIRPTGPTGKSSHSNLDGHGGDNNFRGEAAIIAAAESALADKQRQVTYDTRLTHAIWDLATTGANPAVDLLVCLERRHTIGFRYVDITRPVIIHHGSRDTRVPVENVKWLGKTMRRCEVRVLEGEGHGLMASASVMGGVLMEIAKEWEDWMRVTGQGRREGPGDRRRSGTR